MPELMSSSCGAPAIELLPRTEPGCSTGCPHSTLTAWRQLLTHACPAAAAGELGRLYEEERGASHVHARPSGGGVFQFVKDTLLGPPAAERQGGQEHWR